MANVIDGDFLNEVQADAGGSGETAAEKKRFRKPYHTWEVGGNAYSLKLDADAIIKVEKALGGSLFDTLNNIPPLSNMLAIVQASMQHYHHGTSMDKVKKLYDAWLDEDEENSQIDLYRRVVIPTLVASGFFPGKTAKKLLEDLTQAE